MKPINEILPYGEHEPEISKETKHLYCIHQHSNPLKKIVFKHFLKNIKEICKIHHFEWKIRDPKTNRRKYPSANGNAIHWHKNYNYDDAYRAFADHQNPITHNDLLRLYESLKDMDIRSLFTIAQQYLKDIQTYQENNSDGKYAYKLKALIEGYTLIMDEIRTRLGLDKETEEDTTEYTPVSDNPDHEKQEIQDAWNELLWQQVEPRQ